MENLTFMIPLLYGKKKKKTSILYLKIYEQKYNFNTNRLPN